MVTSCGYRKNKICPLDNETPRPPFYSFDAYHWCTCYTILLLCILFINKNEKVLHDTLVINVGHLSHFLSRSFRIYAHIKLKGLLGMTPIWVFIFVWSSVSRGSWFNFLFYILKNIFLSIFIRIQRKLKHIIGWLYVSISLSHMLMPSETVGICGKSVVYCTHSCLHDSIQLGNETSLVFFSAFNSFCNLFVLFFVKISRQHSVT